MYLKIQYVTYWKWLYLPREPRIGPRDLLVAGVPISRQNISRSSQDVTGDLFHPGR